jgi:hypothetical protein
MERSGMRFRGCRWRWGMRDGAEEESMVMD